MPKHVYSFGGKTADGNGKMKELLGGKGANLAEMCLIGMPVPAGFTITTEVCAAYYDHGKRIPEEAIPQIDEAVKKVEAEFGKKFGDNADPLLVSVRSGAALSMPGMMNTILNLGSRRRLRRGVGEKDRSKPAVCLRQLPPGHRHVQLDRDVASNSSLKSSSTKSRSSRAEKEMVKPTTPI